MCKRNQFTLLELLVVVGVIALLLSLLLPALGVARRKAHEIKCFGSLRQVGAAATMYAFDNNEWLPPATGNYDPLSSLGKLFTYTYAGTTSSGYLSNSSGLLECPSEPSSTWKSTTDVRFLWKANRDSDYLFDYTISGWCTPAGAVVHPYRQLGRALQPSVMAVVADGGRVCHKRVLFQCRLHFAVDKIPAQRGESLVPAARRSMSKGRTTPLTGTISMVRTYGANQKDGHGSGAMDRT